MVQPSLRDVLLLLFDPGAEAPGYYRSRLTALKSGNNDYEVLPSVIFTAHPKYKVLRLESRWFARFSLRMTKWERQLQVGKYKKQGP